jgi:methenyltetrahydromethanopterin cyclohydrolase
MTDPRPLTRPLAGKQASINSLAMPQVDRMLHDRDGLRIRVETLPGGTRIIDAGIACPGGLEAGRRVAEICMGGLGEVQLLTGSGHWPIQVSVGACHPVLACLGSQYAGWSLSHGEGKGAFHALGSGPGRALARKEPLFEELGYEDHGGSTCLVLEVDRVPPQEIIDKVSHDCGVSPDRLTFILTPTRSIAGCVQIVARVLEVALHKAHALHFPLERIVDGTGCAPVPPPAPEFVQAMGRTNDAILFGASVQLYVCGDDDAAMNLANELPCTASRDYGRPFAEIFKSVSYDFYKIDPQLFAPAAVVVTNIDSGNTFRGGRLNPQLLAASFGEAT